MEYKIIIEKDNEFKITYLIDDVEYFLHSKENNEGYPESFKHGWFIYFGKTDDNIEKQFELTKFNTPIKVLNGLHVVFLVFKIKYQPKKVSYISSKRLSNIYKEQYFPDFDVFENGLDIYNILEFKEPDLVFTTLTKK